MTELEIWRTYWTEHNLDDVPDSTSATLKVVDGNAFPNIYAIFKVLDVIPMKYCFLPFFFPYVSQK